MIQVKCVEHLLRALGIQEGTRQAQVLPLARHTSGPGSQAGLGVGRPDRKGQGLAQMPLSGRSSLRGAGLLLWGIFQGLRTHLSAVSPERARPPCWSQVSILGPRCCGQPCFPGYPFSCPDRWLSACSWRGGKENICGQRCLGG